MPNRSIPAIVLVIALGGAPALAGDIYKWTDDQGRVHYSNRGGGKEPEANDAVSGPSSGDEGWESLLERKRGGEQLTEAADNAINSLQARMVKRRREREQAQAELEATQAAIVRAQATGAPELPELRAREVSQIVAVRKIEAEMSGIDTEIAKLRAIKAAGVADKSAVPRFGQ